MTLRHLPAWLFCLAVPVWAQAPSSDAQERARIEEDRTRAEAAFAAQEKACYAKFAVTGCIESARAARRTALADLRRQEIALNDAERRRRAADRVREIEARQAEQPVPRTGRQQTRELPVPAGERAAADSAPAPAPAAAPARPASPASASSASQRTPTQTRASNAPADPAENARRHQERVRAAQQHKEAVQKKAAENTKKSHPLPVPP